MLILIILIMIAFEFQGRRYCCLTMTTNNFSRSFMTI